MKLKVLFKNLVQQKVFKRSLMGFFGLLAFILLINQLDAPLNPQVRELLKSDLPVSEQEKLFYESFIAQNYCEGRALSKKQIQEVLEALEDAAPFTSLYLDDFSKRMQCFNQLFTSGDFAFFDDLTSQHKKNQPATEALIRRTLSLGLKSATPATALDALRSAMLLQYGLLEAEKIQRRNRNFRLPLQKDIRDYIAKPLQVRLEEIRDFEILMGARMLLPLLTDPDSSWLNRMAGSLFFQKNRTLNNLFDYWNESIQQAVNCQAPEGCGNFPKPRMRLYHYILNPFGQAHVVVLAPETSSLTRKLRDRTARITESFAKFH